MCGHKLIHILGEHEVADLTASLDGVEHLQFARVPKLDGPVLGATTWGKQALLVGGPGDGFDSGLVLAELS